MTREDHRDYLFSRALDQVDEGVQIYDKTACAVYFNKASRDISHIPSGIDPRGRHLLDLYNLDEGVSTTMTALRTQSPVINRVDHFEVGDGAHIATANTSYPILREGELLGAVVFEQTQELVQRNIKRLEETGQAMKEYASKASQISFSGYTFDHVIGHNPNLRAAVSVAKKEIFAQSIHRASPRRGKKFLAINCAAIPDTLIESLLFGTQKGSFTGSEDQSGYFEEAAGGTLFLDELNSMRLAMQFKILRVIQENTFRRVGGNKDLTLDVRIISSCNEDPFRSISENRFRRDLFYRPSTVMIELLPLREQLSPSWRPPQPRRPSASPETPCKALWTSASGRWPPRCWSTAVTTSPPPPRRWGFCGRACSTASKSTVSFFSRTACSLNRNFKIVYPGGVSSSEYAIVDQVRI